MKEELLCLFWRITTFAGRLFETAAGLPDRIERATALLVI
jgi:hypothetical protein